MCSVLSVMKDPCHPCLRFKPVTPHYLTHNLQTTYQGPWIGHVCLHRCQTPTPTPVPSHQSGKVAAGPQQGLGCLQKIQEWLQEKQISFMKKLKKMSTKKNVVVVLIAALIWHGYQGQWSLAGNSRLSWCIDMWMYFFPHDFSASRSKTTWYNIYEISFNH